MNGVVSYYFVLTGSIFQERGEGKIPVRLYVSVHELLLTHETK